MLTGLEDDGCGLKSVLMSYESGIVTIKQHLQQRKKTVTNLPKFDTIKTKLIRIVN